MQRHAEICRQVNRHEQMKGTKYVSGCEIEEWGGFGWNGAACMVIDGRGYAPSKENKERNEKKNWLFV